MLLADRAWRTDRQISSTRLCFGGPIELTPVSIGPPDRRPPSPRNQCMSSVVTATARRPLTAAQTRTLALASLGGALEFYDFVIFVFLFFLLLYR